MLPIPVFVAWQFEIRHSLHAEDVVQLVLGAGFVGVLDVVSTTSIVGIASM